MSWGKSKRQGIQGQRLINDCVQCSRPSSTAREIRAGGMAYVFNARYIGHILVHGACRDSGL